LSLKLDPCFTHFGAPPHAVNATIITASIPPPINRDSPVLVIMGTLLVSADERFTSSNAIRISVKAYGMDLKQKRVLC
jgi:hypothetical protein